jgi:hypothetical protein
MLALDGDLSPTLEGTLRLLCGDDAEDVFQLAVHLVHPVDRGCEQSVQKHDRCGHIMAGLGEGTVLRPLRVDGGGNVPGPSSNIGKVNHYGPLRLEHGPAVAQFSQLSLNGLTPIGEFVLPLRSPVLGSAC